MRRIAVVTFSADLLTSYAYIPSEDNLADAPSRKFKTNHFSKRGHRPVVGKLPPRGKFAKRHTSKQAKGLPWWRPTDDVVNDFLSNVCTNENRARYQALFRSFDVR